MTPTATTETIDTIDAVEQEPVDDGVLAELLVEEVSIDGMCGVY